MKNEGINYNCKFAMLDRETDYVDECNLALSDTKLHCMVHREIDDNSDFLYRCLTQWCAL